MHSKCQSKHPWAAPMEIYTPIDQTLEVDRYYISFQNIGLSVVFEIWVSVSVLENLLILDEFREYS